MANFQCSIVDVKSTTARIDAYFSGGDAGYSRYRYLKFTCNGRTWYIQSDSVGGSSSDFSDTITGLSSGTTYSWTAVVCYTAYGEYIATGYTASGSFRTTGANTDIYATIRYNANGGSPTPPAQNLSGYSSSGSGYLGTYLSSTTPTKTGYTFGGWYLGSSGPFAPGGFIRVWGSHSGESYTLKASWTQGGTCRIYTSSGWKIATPYVYSNGWKRATPYVYSNGWKPTS